MKQLKQNIKENDNTTDETLFNFRILFYFQMKITLRLVFTAANNDDH